GAEIAGIGKVLDESAEVESHVDPGVGAAERLPVQIALEGTVELAVLPARAELLGRHEDRRQSRSGLGLEEAEPLAEFGGDKVPERHVVDQADEDDCRQRLL